MDGMFTRYLITSSMLRQHVRQPVHVRRGLAEFLQVARSRTNKTNYEALNSKNIVLNIKHCHSTCSVEVPTLPFPPTP